MDNRGTRLEHIYDNRRGDQITDNDDTSYLKKTENKDQFRSITNSPHAQKQKYKFHLCIGRSMCLLCIDIAKFERTNKYL